LPAKRASQLKATILDFPDMLKMAQGFISQSGLGERVDFLPGNALQVDWPQQQDIVLMSYLMYAVSASELRRLFQLAFGALRPGGRLVIHDFMVDDSGDGPVHASLWLMHGMFSNPEAVCLSPGPLKRAAGDAGFAEPSVDELIPGITRCTVATRPVASDHH
jgi:2-hydroxy-4-(methylsulfanyl)butanoate S-methyltransferase